MTILPSTNTLKRVSFTKNDQTYRLPVKNGVTDIADYGVFTQIAFMRAMLDQRLDLNVKHKLGYDMKAKIFMLTCTE